MGLKSNVSKLSLVMQGYGLKRVFPESNPRVHKDTLTWIAVLTPSPMSDSYTVRILYKLGTNPRINVLEPKLIIPEGKRLPHTYSGGLLCLHYTKAKEWQADMHLYKTIVPWISEWLLHYEIWLATGEWCGGGIRPPSKEKNAIK